MNAETVSAVSAISAFGQALGASFFERQREIRGLLLALVAGENLLLLGPPGTAKSALALALSEATGWRSFVRLMGAQTVPEELFGPFDLSGLRESPSRFERVTDGYLPTAQVAFLDEIFKANSAILNSLLTALNERRYDNGTKRMDLPMEVAIGASNEYPEDSGLDALYDRFMLRYWVDYVRSDSSFVDMLLAPEAPPVALDPAHIMTLRAFAASVTVPRSIGETLAAIRGELAKEHGITASDRRWRKSVRIMQASAALAGRNTIKAADLAVLADCLWHRHEERDAINAVVLAHRSPYLSKVAALVERGREITKDFPEPSKAQPKDMPPMSAAIKELQTLTKEGKALLDASEQDPEVREQLLELVNIGNRVSDAIDAANRGSGRFSL